MDSNNPVLAWEYNAVFHFCGENDIKITNGGVSVHEYALNVSCRAAYAQLICYFNLEVQDRK